MKILSLIIQIIHLILIIVIPLIPLISNKYDILYTSLLFSIILNWNIFKGECILSYFENKSLDNKYKLGDNKPSSYKDVIDDIYPIVSAYITENELLELYEFATAEPHSALIIDGTSSKIIFKKNFNIILKFD